MIFIENDSFACNNIKIYVCVTSGVVLLADWMDLDTLFVVQLREIARVLGSQGSPTESISAPEGLRANPHPGNIETFSLIFKDFSEIPGF